MPRMELRPYQSEAVRAIEDRWAAGDRATLLVMATGCHAVGEKVLMYDGSQASVEDVKAGDLLMGPDGLPRTVLKLHRGEDELYRVKPVKGEPFTVNGGHVLSLMKTNRSTNPCAVPSHRRGGEIVDVTLSEWIGWPKSRKHVHKLYRSSAINRFGENDGDAVTVDPYFLGVLLGDGNIKYSSISVTTMDVEVADEVFRQAGLYGATIRTERAGKATTYIMRSGATARAGGKLVNQLKQLGLHGTGSGDKFVPHCYKTLPIEQRLEVIAGLIDTDGSLSSACGYDFISKSERLASDLAFMCRSVGLAAYVKSSIKKCQGGFAGEYWRVSISGDCSVIPCRVRHKVSATRNQKKDVLRTGFSIEPVGVGRYAGFTVDGDNRYLMGDFTVTHNCGKTVVMAKVAEDAVRMGGRVLVLAHRGELLQQAADKIRAATGLRCSVEKAEETSVGTFERVTVGSVQTLMREKRLRALGSGRFSHILVDEAHHAVSDSYRMVLDYFDGARILGVTATADRGDKRSLGEVFDSLAYEYDLVRAIKEGYLCPIEAQTVPLKVDISGVSVRNGDWAAEELGTALDPYLPAIADEMASAGLRGGHVVAFLPLIKTSQKFCEILRDRGFRAAEVNGQSEDRAEKLAAFARGEYDVLCNSLLLTEGWDCPPVDCIVNLRPTRSRSLYCLDENTEVLTRNGWKADADVGEEVLAFNPDTGETMFSPVIAKVRRRLDDNEYFCSINGQSADIRVTNRHRMLYDNKRRNGWKFATAEYVADLRDGAYIPVSGHGSFPGVPLTDNELAFIGWVMTDGSINKHNNAIAITQGTQQEEYCDEITRCIEGCGFKYTKSVRKRTGVEWNQSGDCAIWTISKGMPRGRDKDKTGWARLEPYLSKDMSPALFDMDERQFDVMLEAIYHADGNKASTTSYHISKGNKTFIERLQAMAIQRGYRASVSTEPGGHARKSDLYTVHLKKQGFVKVGSKSGRHATWVKEPHTEEGCWCVETEMGTIFTRRNGRVAAMGNCQIVGRGTRLSPETGKTHLLLLDFLWMTERMDLVRPAHLVAGSEEVARRMTERLEESGAAVDLEELEKKASEDVVAQREESLARELAAQRHKKARLVDPLQFEMSIADEDLSGYVPSFGWEMAPASDKQMAALEKYGINPESIGCAGKASLMLERLQKRRSQGLSTPKQIRLLEGRGFRRVGSWTLDDASKVISRIASNGWRTPAGMDPATYEPGEVA